MRTNKQDEILGFSYVSEQTTFDSCIKNISETTVGDILIVEFDACLHSFDILNRNQRVYDASNIWNCISTEKIQSLLRDNLWAGESNHPTSEYQEQKLSADRVRQVWLPNRSHLITKPVLHGNRLDAHIKTFPNAVGTDFAKEIIALNAVPEFSCRSIATVQMKNGKPIVVVRLLITYDRVLYPSHVEAVAISTPKAVMRKIQAVTESAASTIIDKAKDNFITIPLKEILESVGNKDVNAGLILESFDLGLDALQGFDESHDHVIIKDNDNMVYCNISPDTKKRVDTFFNSFN